MSSDKELHKLAAVAIKGLREENDALKDQLIKIAKAEQLTFSLFREGLLPVEKLQETLSDFSNKTLQELEIIEKAREFTKSAEYSFTLGTKAENTSTAEERFVKGLLDTD